MSTEFDVREVVAFDFAKELTRKLGYGAEEPALRRIARYADSLILAGSTSPPAFAEAIELEKLGLIDDNGTPIPLTSL